MCLSASRARAFMRDYMQRAGGEADERSDNVDISLAVIISLQTSRTDCIRLRSRGAALSGWKQFASRQKKVPFAAESSGKSAIVDILGSLIESTLLETKNPDAFMFQVLIVVSIVFMFASGLDVDCFYSESVVGMVDVCGPFFSEFGNLDPKQHRTLLESLFSVGAMIHRGIEELESVPSRPDAAATDLAVECASTLVQTVLPVGKFRMKHTKLVHLFARNMQLMIHQGLFWSIPYEISYDSWEEARRSVAKSVSHALTMCLCRTLITTPEHAEYVSQLRLVTAEDGDWFPEETDVVADIISRFITA